jgi:hypothetical protein
VTGHYRIKEQSVTGWYRGSDGPENDHVDVYCGDIFLRRLRCNLKWPTPPASAGQARSCGFAFGITKSLANLLPGNVPIVVIGPDGVPVPHGEEQRPIGHATDGGRALREKLEQGWIVDKWGSLKLPFHAVAGLDQRYLDFYCDISALLHAKLGIEFYLAYGSLLGCVRDGKLIPFDDDIDVAYMSRHTDVRDVAREFHEIKARLQAVAPSLSIQTGVVDTGQMSISRADLRFDIFTSWIDGSQRYNCYFGVSGALDQPSLPMKRVELLGREVTIPAQAERILEWAYGPGWAVPDPHFSWMPASSVTVIMEELRAAGRIATAERDKAGASW